MGGGRWPILEENTLLVAKVGNSIGITRGKISVVIKVILTLLLFSNLLSIEDRDRESPINGFYDFHFFRPAFNPLAAEIPLPFTV